MESDSKSTVLGVINHQIERFNTQVRIKNGEEVIGSTNAKDYKMLKNSLEKFVSERYKRPLTDYQFQDIDISFLEKRAVDMGTKGAIPNRLKKLQAIFNHARDMGIKSANSIIFSNIAEKMKKKLKL